MEHEFLAVENEGMAGVGPALKASDDVILRGKYIYNLSLAFIAPLEP